MTQGTEPTREPLPDAISECHAALLAYGYARGAIDEDAMLAAERRHWAAIHAICAASRAGSEDGACLIAAERARQMDAEGWTPEHDATHARGELADAAECYLHYRNRAGHPFPADWPWASDWWKLSDDPVRNLVKAGALIAAEIDRLRAARPEHGGEG